MTDTTPTESERGRFVGANGLRIYYEEHGQGPPLLLLHGGTMSGAMWQPYLAGFAEHYRVIAPDTRGQGRTRKPQGAMSYRLLAEDTAALARVLGLERPAIFGFSDGGQVALEIGMRFPELARALVVCAASTLTSDSYLASMRHLLGDESDPEVDTERFERENPEWVAELREIYGLEDWKRMLRELKPMWMTPLSYTPADYAGVVATALVLIGDRDASIPVEEVAEMYRRLPNAELAVIAGADHVGAVYANVALTQAVVLDFLRRHGGAPD